MHFKAKLVSWTDIEDWCEGLKNLIVEGYHPDLIIGLARGGLVPARILSDKMWIKDLVSIKTEHWGITATKNGSAVLKTEANLDLGGRDVLIVDDITDTGESMKIAHKYVKSFNPKTLKTATMLHITRSDFVPDFYSREIGEDNWAWFIFPWNVYEDLDNLLGRSLVVPSDTKEIREILKNDYDLDTAGVDLEKILEDFRKAGRIELKNDKWRRKG